MKGMNQMTDNKTIKLLDFKIHGDNRGGINIFRGEQGYTF